ncbi:MAG: response regulator transcription factor [Phycisphaeraceae bacterium]|nr:MAG: response regulator transcription factor [Phycisphaeraceae bacterium]
MARRVLIVDDETDLAELLAYNLSKSGYDTRVAADGPGGLREIAEYNPDLVVLDVMMPGLSGHAVLARIRRTPETSHLPVILLTAKSEENDELEGLSYGADDYVTKPYSMKVLEARIEAILRRASEEPQDSPLLSLGAVTINKETHEARLDGAVIALTVTEFRLLCSLIEAEGRVLDRQALIRMAMGAGVTITERTIDVHVTSIRKKLGKHASMVKTVRGVGYRIEHDRTERGAKDTARS